jgi:hypothetical protein
MIKSEKIRQYEIRQKRNEDYDIEKLEKEKLEIPEKLSIEDILYHLNGVDPLSIQNKLTKEIGMYLTKKEIINLMEVSEC